MNLSMRSSCTTSFAGTDPSDTAIAAPGARVLVIFEDRRARSVLRLLHAGFRHCFCIVGARRAWTICDPLKTRIELIRLDGFSEQQLADHYRQSGRTVLKGDAKAGRPCDRIRVRAISCVEIVKRVVNLDAPYAFTPFQLRRALLEQGFVGNEAIDIAKK
jgi:hypothetical protein